MMPHAHFIAGFLFGVIGYKFGWIGFNDIFIIAIISVLIDLDHYLHYIIKYKDFHPIRFWNTSMKKRDPASRSFVHHLPGMVVIIPFIIAAIFFSIRISYILMAAYLSHMILDHLSYINRKFGQYSVSKLFGIHFRWNFAEETLFFISAIIAMVFLYI